MSSPALQMAKREGRHVGLSLLGMPWLAFITMRYGPGMDVDAVYYMLLARKLAHTGDILHFDSDNPGHWPPLYSMLMAIPFLLKVSYFWGAYVINILLYGISTYLASKQIKALLTQRNMRVVAQLFLLFGFPILYIYVKAQSEILFMTLIIALYHYYIQYIKQPSPGRIRALGIIAALLCLTRYAGLPYVGAVAIVLLLNRQIPAYERLRHIAIFLAIALLPLLLWTLRPLFSPNPHTFQYPDTYTLGLMEAITKSIDVMADWILYRYIPVYVRIPVFIIVILLVIYLSFKKRPTHPLIRLYTISIAIYTIFIICSASLGFCSEPDVRFLSLIYFPLYMISLSAIEYLLGNKRIHADFRWLYKFLFRILMIFMLLAGLGYLFRKFLNGPGGFRTYGWIDSKTQIWISKQPKMNIVYTNCVAAVLMAAKETPSEIYDISGLPSAHKAPKNARTDGAYLIWYKAINRENFHHYNAGEKSWNSDIKPGLIVGPAVPPLDSSFIFSNHFQLITRDWMDDEIYYSKGK